MRCPTCQFDNPDGMKFRGQCSVSFERVCPQCSFVNPPDFKFCGFPVRQAGEEAMVIPIYRSAQAGVMQHSVHCDYLKIRDVVLFSHQD